MKALLFLVFLLGCVPKSGEVVTVEPEDGDDSKTRSRLEALAARNCHPHGANINWRTFICSQNRTGVYKDWYRCTAMYECKP